MAAQAAMALGRLAPLLRSREVWQRVDGLEDLVPVLDLRPPDVDLRPAPANGTSPAGTAGHDQT